MYKNKTELDTKILLNSSFSIARTLLDWNYLTTFEPQKKDQ